MKWEYLLVYYSNQDKKHNRVESTKGKYTVICGDFEFLLGKFDELGAQGWELVTEESGILFYFKRAIEGGQQ